MTTVPLGAEVKENLPKMPDAYIEYENYTDANGELLEHNWKWRKVVVAHEEFGLKSIRIDGSCKGGHLQEHTFYFEEPITAPVQIINIINNASDGAQNNKINGTLRDLKKLNDEGLITTEEYPKKKKEILDSM
jgi:hypothetical protein